MDGLLHDASRHSRIPPLAPALVLAVDEKSQIQALDRTQPGLPMKKGRSGTMTHNYKRNGTTTLLAALDVHVILTEPTSIPKPAPENVVRFKHG